MPKFALLERSASIPCNQNSAPRLFDPHSGVSNRFDSNSFIRQSKPVIDKKLFESAGRQGSPRSELSTIGIEPLSRDAQEILPLGRGLFGRTEVRATSPRLFPPGACPDVNEIPVRCEEVVNKPRPFATGMFLLAEQPYLPIKSPPVLFSAEIRCAIHHRYKRIDPFAELLHPVGCRLAICLMSSGEAIRAKQLVLIVPTVLPTYPPAAAGAFSDGEQPALTEGGIDRRRRADLKLRSAQPFVVDPR